MAKARRAHSEPFPVPTPDDIDNAITLTDAVNASGHIVGEAQMSLTEIGYVITAVIPQRVADWLFGHHDDIDLEDDGDGEDIFDREENLGGLEATDQTRWSHGLRHGLEDEHDGHEPEIESPWSMPPGDDHDQSDYGRKMTTPGWRGDEGTANKTT